jgi:hypothetical protein
MARKAKGRSLGDFRLFLGGRQFYPAELKLLEACAEGKFPSIPSARPTKQTLHNFVRTDFLRFLMLGGDENAPIHEQGVQLRGAWIDGELLDLEGALLPHDVALNHCRINCKIALIAARTRRIDLDGSQISELSGDGIKIKGDLFLRKDFTAQGAVKLTGAKIDGDLDCRGGTFKNASTSALSFDRAEINGNVFLNNGFVAEGDVHLVGAKIAGDLDCNGGIFRKTTDAALDFSRAEIGGDVFLRNKFDANGMVRSKDAKIGGNLDCSNGSFKNPNGHALFFESAKIGGAVLLGYGFSADGEVNLSNAKIGCHFDCRDGTFKKTNTEGWAHALVFDGAEIGAVVWLSKGFSAEGVVRLHGATIKGDLSCENGTFIGAPIEKPWNEGKKTHIALSMKRARVDGRVFLRKLTKVSGDIGLSHAHVGVLFDDEDLLKCLARNDSHLCLDGFTYNHLHIDAPVEWRTRLDWLRSQPPKLLSDDFRPQPWEQLIKVLREMGHK